MSLMNKVLVGGAICGACAFNAEIIEDARNILKDENSSHEQKVYAEKAELQGEVANTALLFGGALALMGAFSKRLPKGKFDLNEDEVARGNSKSSVLEEKLENDPIPFTVETTDNDGVKREIFANAAARRQRGY